MNRFIERPLQPFFPGRGDCGDLLMSLKNRHNGGHEVPSPEGSVLFPHESAPCITRFPAICTNLKKEILSNLMVRKQSRFWFEFTFLRLLVRVNIFFFHVLISHLYCFCELSVPNLLIYNEKCNCQRDRIHVSSSQHTSSL